MKFALLSAMPIVMTLLSGCSESSQAKASLPGANPALQLGSLAEEDEAKKQKVEAAPKPAAAAEEVRGSVQRIQGQVMSRERSSVGFKVSGFIGNVAVKPGDRVKKGDVLAKLDATDFQLNLQLAEARLKQANISLRAVEKDFGREVGLSKANATTQAALEKSQDALEQAQISVKLATLEVSKARRAVNDATLVAPYDCIVGKQQKFAGEYAAVGAAVLDIQETSAQEIVLSVPERYVGDLKIGSELNIVIPSTNYRGLARITRVVDLVSEKTRTFEVFAKPSDETAALTSGIFVEAEIN